MLRQVMTVLVAGVTLTWGATSEAWVEEGGTARTDGGSARVQLGGGFEVQHALQEGQQQTVTLSSLIAEGFDIEAAASTAGSAAQIFLRKDNDVFVCLVLLPVEAGHRESRCSHVD